MAFHPSPEFFGNVLSLAALVWKTAYDLWWNPRTFRHDLERLEHLEAARKKRDRSDRSTAIAFLFLAVSSLMIIGGDVVDQKDAMDQKNEPTPVSQEEFQELMRHMQGRIVPQLEAIDRRLERLEGWLGGGRGPGDPTGPTPGDPRHGGPQGPTLLMRLDTLEGNLQALGTQIKKRDEDVEKKFRDLTETLAEIKRTLKAAESHVVGGVSGEHVTADAPAALGALVAGR